MTNPAISIIVPTCNRPIELKRALKSIATQSFSSYEVLIINNGTLAEYIEDYEQIAKDFDDRFVFLNFYNDFAAGFGPAMARNIGIKASKGEYIAFLDDDDLWHDNQHLTELLAKIDNHHPSIIISEQQGIETIKGQQSCARKAWFNNITNSSSYIAYDESTGSVGFNYFASAAVFPHLNITVYRKDLLEKLNGFDKTLWYEEDLELFIRAANQADIILFNNRCVATHYIPEKNQNKNVTSSIDNVKKHTLRFCLANKLSMLKLKPDINKYVSAMMLFSAKHLAHEYQEHNNYNNAYTYAKLALATRFSVKWLAFTAYIALKRLTRK